MKRIGFFLLVVVAVAGIVAFLIKDKHVAEGYRKHFEVLWRSAKS